MRHRSIHHGCCGVFMDRGGQSKGDPVTSQQMRPFRVIFCIDNAESFRLPACKCFLFHKGSLPVLPGLQSALNQLFQKLPSIFPHWHRDKTSVRPGSWDNVPAGKCSHGLKSCIIRLFSGPACIPVNNLSGIRFHRANQRSEPRSEPHQKNPRENPGAHRRRCKRGSDSLSLRITALPEILLLLKYQFHICIRIIVMMTLFILKTLMIL